MNNGLDKINKGTGDLVTSSILKSLRTALTDKQNLDTRLNSMKARVLPAVAEDLKRIKAISIELVNIIDCSLSCKGTEIATASGYNELISKERNKGNNTIVTTSLFNGTENLLYEGLEVAKVPYLTYSANGGTALYDTLVTRLKSVKERHRKLGANAPQKTIVTIMTDGRDEHSTLYGIESVRRLIVECRELGWEFIFLGANIDAKFVASNLGIPLENAEQYNQSQRGILTNFKALELDITSVREEGKLNPDWSKIIRKSNNLALEDNNNLMLGGR